jgi:hypothetical protein
MMKYLPTSRLLVCTPRPYLSAFFDGFFQIRSLALLLGLLIPLSGFGQTTPCTEGFGRYVDLIFAESQVSPDIQYGQNMTIGGTSQNLLMDVYDALGDTASRRIPIILAANGAFSGGTRANLAALSRDFAERGYVVFAIDTRPFDLTLGGGTTEAQMLDWLVKSAGDVKAAVRFIKQETANNSNPYRINPNIIFIGGVGTGAMAALHAGMVGPDDNVTAAYQTALDNNDGFEGNSNSIVAFNSDVRGVISYSGALVDADWLDTDDPLLIAFHDDGDPEVPFGAGTFAPGGVSSPLTVEGSSLIAQRAVAESVFHELNTITSSNVHVSYLGGQLGNTTRTTGEFINDVNCNNRFPNVVDCSNDQQPPSITCPGNIAPVDLGSNCQSTLSDYRLFVNASDACDDNLTLEQSPAPETMIQGPQTVTVTVTATDDAGNFANCQYVIPLVDNTPPVAVCPTIPDVIIGTNGIGVLPPNIGQGLSTDNCGTPQESSPGRTFNCSSQLGPQTVTLTANDGTQTATAACSYVVLAGNGACCNETRTALALNAYNCDGVAGNNPGGSGNCIDINGESVIRLFACTNNPFTVAGVEAEIMTNDNYGKLGGGGTIPSPTLSYYDTFAEAAAGTNATTLSTVLARFAASEASNDPQTEFVWVTQSDPNSGCSSSPSLLRLRLRPRPEVSLSTPSPLLPGASINLFTLAQDNRNVAEAWNIYDADPRLGNAIPLASSPADASGEPTDPYSPIFAVEGTFSFWFEAINEGSGIYDDDCTEVASVTITVGDPCDVPVLALVPVTTICSGSATGIILSEDPSSEQPIDRVRVRKTANTPADATSFRVIGPGFNMDYESDDLSVLSTEIFILEGTNTNGEVIYTVTPIGADDCEGAPIEVRVVVEPPTCATSPVLEPQNVTVCSGENIGIVFTPATGSPTPDRFVYTMTSSFTPPDATSFRVIGTPFNEERESNDPAAIRDDRFILEGTSTPGVVTYTVTPYAGNANGAPFEFTVTVEPDNEPPVAVCQNATVQLNVNGVGILSSVADVDGGSTDNCGISFWSLPGNRPFTCADVGNPVELTLTVVDNSANSASCTYMVTVEDNIAPTLTNCSGSVQVADDDCVWIGGGGLFRITENCDPVILDEEYFDEDGNNFLNLQFELNSGFYELGSGRTYPLGVNTVELTVTDAQGQTGTCSLTVEVVDETDPVITTTPQSIVLDENGFASLTVADLASATDNCGVESLTARRIDGPIRNLEITADGTILNFSCEDIGENIFEITATDVNGNSSTAEATVIVDFEQPLFACISELNLTLDEFCVAELIPRMFLTGEVACLDEFPMKITVFDDNPDNGGIVDGCGRFQFKVESTGTGALDLDFATCWGYVNAEDKTAPNEVATPEDVELPCVDFEEIMLTMLPSDINRCWEVERVEEDNDDTSNGLYTISQPGFVLVEGTMAPALKDRLDLIAGDVSSSDPNFSAGPAIVAEFSDGCAPRLQICVNDVATFGEDPGCDDIVITRTFTATELDNCENAAGEENGAATASFEITFKRPSIDDFVDEGVTELEVAHYECDEALDADANGNPIPRASDVPVWDFNGTGREIPLLVNADLCNIALTYEDGPRINTCPNTYKFVRTYTIIDWCKPVEVKTLTQVVKVGDTAAPDFTGPVQDNNFDGTIDGDGTEGSPLIFTTNAGDECAAYIRLDDPTIKLTDNCSAGIELKADIYPNEDTDGAPIGTFYLDLNDGDAEVAGPIPAGTHTLRYTYTDDCGNSDYTDLTFTVEDRTAPVAICEDGLNVSLTSGGTTAGPSTGVVVLTPDMVDKNSYDDCSDVTLKIGRVMQLANGTYELLPDTDYEHQLLLDCSDLGTVLVGLEVTDEAGNVNYCWLEVLVEDKARPICFAPAPVTISCIEYNAELPADLSEATNDELDAAFGPATAVDNCGATVAQTITGDVNSCGVGQFTRTFTVTDAQGLTNAADCEQVIRVYGVHDYTLIFPTDAEADCMEDPVYDGVEFEERACDLITINTIIDTFPTQTTAADECFKLEITYDVINWCEYNSIGQAYLIPRDKEDGRRDVEQDELYLHVRPGEDSFDNLGDDDAWLSLFNEDGSAGPTYDPGFPQYDIELDNGNDLDGDDDDNGDDNIDNKPYSIDDSRGFFRYVQFVKIYDEEEPVVMVNEPTDCFAGIGDECVAEVTLSFTAMDDCSDVSVSVELDAEYKGTPTEFERTRFLTSSEVVDNGDGSYTVRLTDVPVGDHALRVRAGDGCGNFDVDILEFCVSADKAPTPICIQTMTVTLMPDGNGGGMAAIWATDFINSDVEDCFGNVIDKYSIYTEEEANESGFLPVVGRDGIELTCEDFGGDDVNVRVYAIDNNSNADYCAVVLEVQAFQEGLCEGSSGSLSGLIMTQDAELMAGVEVSLTGDNAVNETVTTAADGQYRFTNLAIESDYTVNPDYRASFDFGAVTVTDIVSITNHILGTNVLTTGYDHVAADVNLDADVNIFDLVAMRRVILGLQDELNDAGATWRFVEAGYNLTPGNWMATFPEVYNVNNLQGNITEADFVVVELGNVVRSGGRAALELKVEDAELAAGQTHTIELTNGELAGFQGTLELAAGLELVNVSYEGEGAMNLNRAGEGLLAMAFNGAATINVAVRATEALRLSEAVSLTDAITLREGTAANGTAGSLRLNFGNLAPASAHNALEQNMPNPVAETTRIAYTLATAGQVTLTVQDIQGRTVLVRELEGAAGRNVIELNVSELGGAAGVLSYTVTSGDFTATKKMVVVR